VAAIEVHGVSKAYVSALRRNLFFFWRRPALRRVALDNLEFTADYGEIVGVIGANGAGKSTLLRLLAGRERPDLGELRVAGLDPSASTEDLRSLVGVVDELDEGFRPASSLRTNLEFAAGTCGRYVGRPDFEFLLDSLALRDDQDLPWKMASQGLRRRVSMMRALLGEPRILLLDEPTRSLDSETAEKANDLILQAAHSRGACVVLVSHAPDDIRDLCDRSLVLDQGRLLYISSGRTATRAGGGALV